MMLLLGNTAEVGAVQLDTHHKHKKEAEKKKHHHKKHSKHHKKHKKDDDKDEEGKDDTAAKKSKENVQVEQTAKEAQEITNKATSGLKNLEDNDASLSDMLSFSKAIAQGKTA